MNALSQSARRSSRNPLLLIPPVQRGEAPHHHTEAAFPGPMTFRGTNLRNLFSDTASLEPMHTSHFLVRVHSLWEGGTDQHTATYSDPVDSVIGIFCAFRSEDLKAFVSLNETVQPHCKSHLTDG